MNNIPGDYRFTKEHEWASYDSATGIATIGVTLYATEKLGEIVYVELPEKDTELKREDTFGIVESTKSVSDLFAPVSGVVVDVNDTLLDSPELVSEDPHDEGWMIRLKVTDPAELDELMSATDYETFIGDLEED